MKRRTLLALLGSSSLVLAGCLGDDDDDTGDDEFIGGDDDDGTEDGDNGENDDENDEPAFETPTAGAETFVDHLAAEDFEAGVDTMTEQAQEFTSPAALESLWRALTNVGGEYQEILSTEETEQSGFDAVDATLAFERSEHRLRIVVDFENAPQTVLINDDYETPGYVDSDAFETVTSEIERDGCLMDSVVTVPEGEDEVPGVLLVHGSDPQGQADYDLTTGIPQLGGDGSKPFKDLAEGLASQGIAVYRYDKRTYACNVEPGDHTLDNVVVDDALAALEDFRDIDGVDADRLAVAGLSLGGMALPRIAERDGTLVAGIGLAAPARSFYEVTLDQLGYLATVTDHERPNVQDLYENWQERVERIRDGEYESNDIILDHPGALWESLDTYDHVELAREIDIPLYFLQGERDYQVTVEADFDTWQAELAEREATAFEVYDGLNHLFQYGEGRSVPEEYTLYNPVDPAVIDDIADWLPAQLE